MSADSAGDDLYTWNVELWRTAFKPDCELAKVSTGCPHPVAPQAASMYHSSSLLACGVASCTGMARHNDCQAHTLLAWPAMLCIHSTHPPPVTHNNTHPQCCCILQDLAEVSSKFAVSSVQLRFTFMRGLHPFYPPRVEVVRPHLSTPLPGALSSHPLLRLENWHPTLTMTQVVDNIRAFLEVRGGCGLGLAARPMGWWWLRGFTSRPTRVSPLLGGVWRGGWDIPPRDLGSALDSDNQAWLLLEQAAPAGLASYPSSSDASCFPGSTQPCASTVLCIHCPRQPPTRTSPLPCLLPCVHSPAPPHTPPGPVPHPRSMAGSMCLTHATAQPRTPPVPSVRCRWHWRAWRPWRT